MKTMTRFFCLSLLASAGWSCSDDEPAKQEPFVIQSIGLSGSTTEASTVVVDQQDDSDGTDDQSWSASFNLDGGTRADSLAADDASQAQTHVVTVKGTQVSDSAVSRTRVTIQVGAAEAKSCCAQ